MNIYYFLNKLKSLAFLWCRLFIFILDHRARFGREIRLLAFGFALLNPSRQVGQFVAQGSPQGWVWFELKIGHAIAEHSIKLTLLAWVKLLKRKVPDFGWVDQCIKKSKKHLGRLFGIFLPRLYPSLQRPFDQNTWKLGVDRYKFIVLLNLLIK